MKRNQLTARAEYAKIRTNMLVSGVLYNYIVYEYNPEKKLIREIEYDLENASESDSFITNKTTEYAYDSEGRLVSRQGTDAMGQTETTIYEYDNKGLLSKEVKKSNVPTQTNGKLKLVIESSN